MMETDDDLLHLSVDSLEPEEPKQIAVSPFAIFEEFDISPAEPDDNSTTPETVDKARMDPPNLSSDFPSFNDAAPWMNAPQDDPAMLAQSTDQISHSNWEEWMKWENPSQDHLGDAMSSSIRQGLPSFDSKTASNSRGQSDINSSTESTQHLDVSAGVLSSRIGPNSFEFEPRLNGTSSFHFNVGALASPPETDTLSYDPFFNGEALWNQDQRTNEADVSPVSLRGNLISQENPPLSTPSLEHSPESLNNAQTGSESPTTSPDSGEANKKKRKATSDDEEKQTSNKQGPVKKTAHNMIEKRYRTNLNDKIAALRDSVPSLRVMSRPNGTLEDDDPEDLEGLTPAHKLNKATVLSKATEYIRHLEKRNKRLTDELADAKARLDTFNKLAMTTVAMPRTAMNTTMNTPGPRYADESYSASPQSRNTALSQAQSHAQAQGMIPVPESMANLHRRQGNQQHYAHPNGQMFMQYPRQPVNQQPMINGRGGNPLMHKVIIGSFTGLMVLEGLSQRQETPEDPDGKGLLALPLNLLRRWNHQSIPWVGDIPAHINTLLVFKFALVAMALFLLIGPFLNFKPKSKKTSPIVVRPPTGLSLASPVELRRQAWLTAVQSIWVPRHSFILEVAALGMKILKLSTRKLIGWPGYAFLTGTTIEQEEGRVKAWEIAIDAQLTGGDEEISVSRLVLTLMASGTLPDTPARLMLKSLHIRILLWEVANAGYRTWFMFEEISVKLARHYWNQARAAQKLIANSKSAMECDKLPAHLAALLEIECDDVLVDPLVQRGYNLAWNRNSADKTDVDSSLDSVVEDFAISSPLDALAAWWSSLILNRALAAFLADDSTWSVDLALATDTAPSTSGAHGRALVAKAVLADTADRARAVSAALAAIPSALSDSRVATNSSNGLLMNVVGSAPVSVDVLKSLTFARCLSLAEQSLESDSTEARLRATYPIRTNCVADFTLSLLSCVAAHRVLLAFSSEKVLLEDSREGLERLASALRVWVGRDSGRKSGLSRKARGAVTEDCVRLSMALTGMGYGMDIVEGSDDGYVSGDAGEGAIGDKVVVFK